MSVNAEQTVKAVEKVVAHFKDGFQFADIIAATKTAMEIAEQFTGLPGDEKRAFVIDVIRKAYKEVNPNIPWVPEPIETWVENYVLDNLIPAVIEFGISATKGMLGVNKE